MDYYDIKYKTMCVAQTENNAVDIIVKDNKIYKVQNHRAKIEPGEFGNLVDKLVIDYGYVLESSNSNMTLLVHPKSDNYVCLCFKLDENTGKKYWEFEMVIPEVISTTN